MNERGNCHVPPVQKTPSADEAANSEKATLRVSGMGCVNCANRVRNSLMSQHGVVAAEIDLQRGLALIQHNPDLASIETLLAAVEAAGNDGRHHYQANII